MKHHWTVADVTALGARQAALHERFLEITRTRFGQPNCVAILRQMRPDWVIPAVSALNFVQAADGYRRGLRASANMVTVNLTPHSLQRDYVIYKRDRFIMDEERVLNVIVAEGLTPSDQSLAEFYQNNARCESTRREVAILS
jgi:hypothetical protein